MFPSICRAITWKLLSRHRLHIVANSHTAFCIQECPCVLFSPIECKKWWVSLPGQCFVNDRFICVSSKLTCWGPTHNVTVFGGGDTERWLGHGKRNLTTISFTIGSKSIKYLEINYPSASKSWTLKNLKVERCAILMNQKTQYC